MPLSGWHLSAVAIAVSPPAAPRRSPHRLWADIDRPARSEPEPAPVEPVAAPPVFSEAEMALACAEAGRQAVERERAGQAAARARTEALAVDGLAQSLAAARASFQTCLDGLASGVARTLALAIEKMGALDDERPARLEAVLRATFAETLHAPGLRITVPEDLLETIGRAAGAAVAAAGFGGACDVAGDPGLPAAMLRIDWADGWAEADLAHVERLLIEHLNPTGRSGMPGTAPAAPDED